jgi:hypothetical protein
VHAVNRKIRNINVVQNNTRKTDSKRGSYVPKLKHDFMNKFVSASLNVRSLLPKIDEVSMLALNNNLDIFGINETWLDSTIPDSAVNIPGYKIYRKDRNRQGGGVALYVKSTITAKLIEFQTSIECVWVEITNENEKLMVGSMYRPPSAGCDYYDHMINVLEHIHNINDKMVLLGDLNFDYSLNENLSKNPLHYIENAFCMTQLVTIPTRVTEHSSTVLDVILSTIPNRHKVTSVLNTSLSDHKLIYTVIDFKYNPKSDHNEIRFRSYKNFSLDDFLYDMKTLSGHLHFDFTDVNHFEKSWHSFKEGFVSISDKHAPIKCLRLKPRQNPWINHEIVKLMYKRDFLKSKADKTKNPDMYSEYRKLRNMITSKIRYEKKKYFEDRFFSSGNDAKQKAKVLNLIQDKNCQSCIPPQMEANKFNDFFSKIGKKTAEKLNKNHDFVWRGQKSIYAFSFTSVDSYSVLKCLRKLGSNVSKNDVLNIDSKLLCLSADIIAPIITDFINCSLSLGYVIKDWKLSRVTPIFKGKGDILDENNYRPISVISHICKILEKEVQKQLVKYLCEHDFITLSQSAYRKFHGTHTSVHRVIEDLLDNVSDRLYTGICMLDLSKCFDTINHGILLEKLKYYGILNQQHKWFTSYLNERSQVVVCNNKLSDKAEISIGVPQGSVLGPILFLLFSNDLPNSVHSGSCNMFADDTILYVNAESEIDVENKLQKCVNEASKWFNENNLLLNAQKSNTMLIEPHTCKNNLHSFNIHIDGNILENVDTALYLGLLIDKKLTWSDQINRVSKTLGMKISNLKRAKKFGNKEILKYIYQYSIQPVIDYGITIWSDSTAINIHKIQRLQNYCARIVMNNFDFKNTRGIDLVKDLKWMSVKQRIDYFLCLTMFKCLHDKAPVYMQNEVSLVSSMNNKYREKREFDIYLPSFMSNTKEKSVYIRGAKVWNKLPFEIKSIQNIDTFKREYKKFHELI